jgi:hypothetical protein
VTQAARSAEASPLGAALAGRDLTFEMRGGDDGSDAWSLDGLTVATSDALPKFLRQVGLIRLIFVNYDLHWLCYQPLTHSS